MKFDDGLSSEERVEAAAQLQAQVDQVRWLGGLSGSTPIAFHYQRLTLRRALRRILCSHSHRGSMINDEMFVQWCEDCGHTEIVLKRLAPDPEWFPEGRPAWSSAAAKPHTEELSWPHLVIVYGLALFLLGLVVDLMR